MQPTAYATAKMLHPFYRDTLSQTFTFSPIGNFPTELIQWAVNSTTLDVHILHQHFERLAPTGLSPADEKALKLTLEIIVVTNAILQVNRPGDHRLSENNTRYVKERINEILTLAPNMTNLENTVRILLRLNEIDEMVPFIDTNWRFLMNSAVVRNIMGFLATVDGQYTKAIDLLLPLQTAGVIHQYPFADMCLMSAQYALKQWPQTPLRYDSIKQRHRAVDLSAAGLPQLTILHEVKHRDRPILTVACDEVYFFEHALPLAYSLHETNADALSLHLHLYSPNRSVLAEIEGLRARLPKLDIGVSIEEVPGDYFKDAKHTVVYYSCVRFIRAQQLLEHYNAPLCLIDVDALLKNSWVQFCQKAGLTEHTDIAIVHRPAGPPWEHVLAGFLYLKTSAVGKAFAADVAAFIVENFRSQTLRWFLDQVALTAVYDAHVHNLPGILRLPYALALDQEHRGDSFLWVVTNHKDAWPNYNAYRAQLADIFASAPRATPDYFYRTLSERQPVFFLQIGVMDGASYDPIHPYIRHYGWKGILVEPLPDMMERAKANYAGQEGLIFENVAITKEVETRVIYRVKPEDAAAAQLPTWVTGMSSFVPGKLDMYKQHVVEEPVRCMPLADMLANHAPERIDVLQIDTEGYDYKIFEQFDVAHYRPAIINLEYVNLSADEKEQLQDTLLEHGYVFFKNELDLFAVQRECMFPVKKA